MREEYAVKVITDREVQLARDRVYEAGDYQLDAMLQKLLDFRKHGRVALSEHDFRVYYNRGISWMASIVNQSGCEWWTCGAAASTSRQRRSRVAFRLCRAHADEGEARGLWDEGHSNNMRWKQEDAEERARSVRVDNGGT
jgi:hypothetical protein